MFIELHMIQNFAPANLNRDDTNSPKDCEFGGARRARISSQCIKRAIRTCPVFEETTRVSLGTRTRWLGRLLKERLEAEGKPEEEVTAVLDVFVPKYATRLDSETGRTNVLLYMGEKEIDDLVTALLEEWNSLADGDVPNRFVRGLVRDHEGQTSAPDIALFGRMLAEKPALNLDAACQVAHAISTHRVTMEMDFYTAVDDLATEEETGAGMMGVTGYNSSCFYRYSRIDWKQLAENLNGDLDLSRRTVEGFLRAAVAAVPSGKQNAFAAHNPPAFLLAVVRNDGMGWSLANAFERPVRPGRDSGLVDPSIRALDAYWGRLCRIYGDDMLEAIAVLSLETDTPLDNLTEAQQANLDQWIATVLDTLPGEEEVI